MSNKANFMANLMKAKAVMDKTDADNPIITASGNMIESTKSEGKDVNWGANTDNMLSQAEMMEQGGAPQTTNIHETPKIPQANAILNSKLPAKIKQAMLENPIPQAQVPSNSFTLEEIQQTMGPGVIKEGTKSQIQNEIVNNLPTNINEQQLRTMIDEQIGKYFARYFTKTMMESIKKQVLMRKKK